MIFNIRDFPKFWDAHIGDNIPWETHLHNDGYSSAKHTSFLRFEMADIEYTHFVLKWS
jgi:hypothetical protein